MTYSYYGSITALLRLYYGSITALLRLCQGSIKAHEMRAADCLSRVDADVAVVIKDL
jgi:hypothetical protein